MFLSKNVYVKCKQVVYCYLCISFTFGLAELLLTCLVVYPFFILHCCNCLFTSLSSFFILMLLLYFCLFVDLVNKPILFVFVAFVYHFKNTITIFVTILKKYFLGDIFPAFNLKRLLKNSWFGVEFIL